VPWCLMMQSKLFSDMWTNLGQEEKVAVKEKNKDAEDEDAPFIFNLPTITNKCFRRIVGWMRHQHGKPEFELKFGKETGQVRILYLLGKLFLNCLTANLVPTG